MTTALYRRYRPDSFADVVGQEHVTGPLRQALRSNRVNHAYLFSGPRGCGKTTSARILARILNCHANTDASPTDTPCGTCPSCVDLATGGPGSLDVVEIDAASHGGVDDARELRERATFSPTRDRFKIFILDEAHMVTPQGFNALLKIVEEPPAYLKFIFATTEPDKVIGTIRSRTHHYPFRLVPPEVMVPLLEKLCAAEGVAVGSGVLPLVVRAGGGSVRDTLSVMDQLIAGSGPDGVDYELAVALLGYTHATLLDDAVGSVASRDGAALFRVVDRVVGSGHEPRRFVEDLLERLRDLVVIAVSGDEAGVVLRDVPVDQLERMTSQAAAMGVAELSRAADLANEALTQMTGATSPRMHLELLCARLLLPAADGGEQSLAARVDRLERGLGPAVVQASAPVGASGDAPASSAAGAPGAASSMREEIAPAPRGDAGRGASAARAALAAATGKAAPGAGPAPASGPAPAAPADPAPAVIEAAPAVPAAPAVEVEAAPVARDVAASTVNVSPPPWDVPEEPQATPPLAEVSATVGQDGAGRDGAETIDKDTTAPDGAETVGRDAAAPAAEAAAAPAAADEPVAVAAHDLASGDEAEAESAVVQAPVGHASSEHPVDAASDPASARELAPTQEAAPEEPAAERRAPDTTGGEDSETLRRRWDEVLATLSDLKKATWILVKDNAHVAELTQTTLRLAFTAPGLVGAFRNGPHPGLVQQAVRETLGYDVTVEAEVQGDTPVQRVQPAAVAPAATRTSAHVDDAPVAQPHAARVENPVAEPAIVDSWDVVPVGTWTADPTPAAQQPAEPRPAEPQVVDSWDVVPVGSAKDTSGEPPAADPWARAVEPGAGAPSAAEVARASSGGAPVSSPAPASTTASSPAAAASPSASPSVGSASVPSPASPASSSPVAPPRSLGGAAAARAAALAARANAQQPRTATPEPPAHDDVPPLDDEPSYDEYEDSVPFTETTLMGVPLVVKILEATVLEETVDGER